MSSARIFDIQRFSLHNGPGIRTTVFFKGCNLRCLWCHNPESQSGENELLFYEEKCVSCGACRAFCPKALSPACESCGECARACRHGAKEQSGKTQDTKEIVAVVLRDRRYYETGGGGVTLSGGEPLLQPQAAYELLRGCKAEGLHTAVETAGNADWSVFARLLPVTDLFLFDIKGIDAETHRKNTGVPNNRILENARLLAGTRAAVRFRMPYVPGFNDTQAPAVAAFAHALGRELELMAFHRLGAGKYRALRRPYPAENVCPPGEEEMRRVAGEIGALYEPAGV